MRRSPSCCAGPGAAVDKQIAGRLVDWYRQHQRPLPWREQPTAYRVWVSEIMLQQTRIEAVRPYFQRFMAALPTVEDLARVPEEQLLKLWEGLGYYNRARNLQKAAQLVCREYQGRIPDTYEQILRLPGIGEYTAGAILSIAYGVPEPAVDGNVLRVVARLTASEENVSRPVVKKRVRQQLKEIIPTDAPGEFNQGIMELGETLCLPNGVPLCAACPVQEVCRGRALGIAERLPVRDEKKQRAVEERTVFLLCSGGRVALSKRAKTGLLAGLWEFPSADGSLAADQAEQWCRELQPRAVVPAGRYRHIFTHREWHMRAWRVDCAAAAGPYQWVTGAQLQAEYALPTAFRPFLGALE